MNLLYSNITIYNKYISLNLNELGLSFEIQDNFSKYNINETKLIINYAISLYTKKVKFGIINASYETLIPENMEFITLNEPIKQKVLLT